jgi:hypothetical protein
MLVDVLNALSTAIGYDTNGSLWSDWDDTTNTWVLAAMSATVWFAFFIAGRR